MEAIKESNVVFEEASTMDSVPLSGEEVESLKDKSFEIVSQGVEKFKDKQDSSREYTKTCLKVRLSEGSTVKWYPNTAALKVLIAKKGRGSVVGYKGKFFAYVKPVYGIQTKCVGVEA